MDMVTKKEILAYYAQKRQRSLDDMPATAPPIVIMALERMPEDEHGIYTLASELMGEREYPPFTDVIDDVRAYITATIRDLEQIRGDRIQTYSVDGYRKYERIAKAHGNSARILLPASELGKRIVAIVQDP